MSDPFVVTASSHGLSVTLRRGERMCLIGMNVDEPAADFVGFAIEVKTPRGHAFTPLKNRLAFAYDQPVGKAVTGAKLFSSLDAPFQMFRWIHFPDDPDGGRYTYRVTQMHMPADGPLVKGASVEASIALDPVVYDDFLEIGFTRNFASSQAYASRYGNNTKIIPAKAADGLSFKKVPGDVYQWLGFEAYALVFKVLTDVRDNPDLTLDVFAYDLDEPDIVALFASLKTRLRIVIDNSADHAAATSAESQAAARLAASAGAANVKRMKFIDLQHNKVLIVKSKGQPTKVLFGSTNFSFRGLYIQANNALVVHDTSAAQLFEDVFSLAFDHAGTSPKTWFEKTPTATAWHAVTVAGKPPLAFCFSPHADTDLSMKPVGDDITAATSSVFFSIAFLSQTTSGPVRKAIDALMTSPLFSYGISDKDSSLQVHKPDGSIGIVDFAYLQANSPPPFEQEWSGGSGIHEHHKFVVTDFSLPTATVFTGSSNLAPSGEAGNGDNLVKIQDPRVATSYAMEALRIFDHLHFRVKMQAALAPKTTHGSAGATAAAATTALTLQKPTALSGKPAWFADSYNDGSEKLTDRLLFGRTP